jgi:hypothetical protein
LLWDAVTSQIWSIEPQTIELDLPQWADTRTCPADHRPHRPCLPVGVHPRLQQHAGSAPR